jgi:ankyrin repeat protein
MNSTRRTFMAGSAAFITVGQVAVAQVAHAGPMDIFQAAEAGNLDRAKELIKESPDMVNARSSTGLTPLYFAARNGQVEMIMLLQSLGADLSGGSESPVIAVAEYKDPAVAADMAQPLLNNGSNPNAGWKNGTTALHIALAHGNLDVARILIHRGATVNPDGALVEKLIPDASKIERVYFAGRYTQDMKGTRTDRDRGVEDTQGLPQTLVNQFATVAHFDADKVKEMHRASKSILSTRSTWDELAIEAAAHMGIEPLAQYLADAGSPVSTCTAVLLGQTKMVREMVREDRNRLRERGAHDFPLLNFVSFGPERSEIAGILLEAGCDPNAFGRGQSPLHIAASKGYVEVAALLLDHGANVNTTPQSRKGAGPTPLAVAVQKKQEKMAELLKSRGGRA